MSSSASVPKQHKAAVLSKKGASHEIQDWPTPSLRRDEVLVKITAAAVNPVDWKMRDWGVFIPRYPIILGSDAAGQVAAVGEDVKEFKQGDRVFFQGIISTTDGATFQEYTKMPADLVAHTPDNVTDEEAAGIALASIAVLVGYYHESGFDIKPHPWQKDGAQAGKGKAIVILGGSSSAGQYAIQLARLSGFETIVTGSSASHHDYLRKLGATHVLDRLVAKPEDYVKAATADGHAFAMVFDSIASTSTQLEGVAILQHANKQGSDAAKKAGLPTSTVVTLYTAEDPVEKSVKAGEEKGAERVDVKTVWGIGSKDYLRSTASAFMRALSGPQGWLATKQYLPNRPIVLPGGLPGLDKALDRNREGVSGQKIVIRPSEA